MPDAMPTEPADAAETMPADIARPAAARPGRRRATVPAAAGRPGVLPGLVLSLSAGLALAPCAALGQRLPPEQRYYQVEVLIFAQPAGASVELPPRQPPEIETTDGEGAVDIDSERDARLPPDERLPNPDSMSPLLPDGFGPPRAPVQLEEEAARLERNGYRVLWHQAWIQAPAARDGVPLALLSALGQGPVTPALSGSINLSTGRFLHLGMALELRSTEGLEAELSQRRRIRPAEAHYFDHPRIGAIAIAQPLERALAIEWRRAGPDEPAPRQSPWRP